MWLIGVKLILSRLGNPPPWHFHLSRTVARALLTWGPPRRIQECASATIRSPCLIAFIFFHTCILHLDVNNEGVPSTLGRKVQRESDTLVKDFV